MTPSPGFFQRLPFFTGRPWLALVVTLGVVAVAWLLRHAIDPLLPPGFPYLTFFPAVICTALLFGPRQGIVAATLGGLCAWYFFIPPIYTFGLTHGTLVALALYGFVVTTEIVLIDLLTRSNRRLARERATSALLFSELQHRVSNNLQMVAALLTLQKRTISDPDAHAALDEAARRLGVIGRISRQLHDPDGGKLGLEPFLYQLCGDVIEASGRDDVVVEIRAADAVDLKPDAAIPVALIVAEAVSNALEHGFAGGVAGRIDVAVNRSQHGVVVSIADDGRGVPPGFSMDASDSLGLRIAMMLAKQMRGRFDLQPHSASRGTVATLTIPA